MTCAVTTGSTVESSSAHCSVSFHLHLTAGKCLSLTSGSQKLMFYHTTSNKRRSAKQFASIDWHTCLLVLAYWTITSEHLLVGQLLYGYLRFVEGSSCLLDIVPAVCGGICGPTDAASDSNLQCAVTACRQCISVRTTSAPCKAFSSSLPW